MIKILTLAFPILLFALLPTSSKALEPNRPGQQTSIKRAIFAGDRVFMLSDSGELYSASESGETPTNEALSDPVLDMCMMEGSLIALSNAKANPADWTFYRRDNASWSAFRQVPSSGESPIAISCAGSGILILTATRLVKIDQYKVTDVPLKGSLGRGGVTSLLSMGDYLLVGFNAGEWGGGLQRINRADGVIERIERNETGELCSGPLNTECDPVTALSSDPWNSGCAIATVGLVHFEPHGRVLEVCSKSIRRIYYRAYGPAEENASASSGGEPFSTVAYFGLLSKGKRVWAVGIDGIYEVTLDGKASIYPLPTFRKIGPFRISFSDPNFVLVLTSINQRLSISGSVPLIISR